jgi:uncharacterized membrane protein YphA (DoxX/SURF4 family)
MKIEEKQYNWKEIVSLVGAVFLGAVLVAASIGKVLDPVMFVEQIRKEGLEIIFSANNVALIALAIETVLGMALLLGVRTFWIVFPSAGLSAFFLFLTGRSYWYVLSGTRESDYDCGCFGVFMQRTAVEAFWQDVSLLLIPLALIFIGSQYKSFKLPPVRTAIALVSGVIICVWAVVFVGMPPSVPDVESPVFGSVTAEEEGLDLYEPSGQYGLLIDGLEINDAMVFESQVSLRLILISDEFSNPIVLDIRNSRIYKADPNEVSEKSGAGLTLPIEPVLEESGEFGVDNRGLSFVVDGKAVNLISK